MPPSRVDTFDNIDVLSPVENPASGLGRQIKKIALRERFFLLLLGLGFMTAGMFYQNAAIARWIGFLFAGYAAIGNDSIQTIGTFLASNKKQPWWLLWLFMGSIFFATALYSFIQYGGDVSYGRLSTKGFSQTPQAFSFLQIAAPLFLLVLTRLRMPVSTTFLLLTSFTTAASSVGKVLGKSLSGYVVAFGCAFLIYLAVAKLMERWTSQTKPHAGWRVAQWSISGLLWSFWLMQDAANIAVYLPRQMNWIEFAGFAVVILAGLAWLFRARGERIQEVVDEKSSVVDVRAATLVDFIYAGIIYYFKVVSSVPMSTTWVFIGLLGGRELAIAFRRSSAIGSRGAFRMICKDLLYVGIGLLVSIVLAAAANDGFRDELLSLLH